MTPQFKSIVDPIPVGMAEAMLVYGDPNPRWVIDTKGIGRWVADPAWENQNCKVVSASLISGYDKRIYMHKKVAPNFLEAMRRAKTACPKYEFHKIGCFNVRRQLHDTPEKAKKEGRALRAWSDHYMAIAFDINDGQNKGFTWKPGMPKPFEPGWVRYSDLPQGVVEAFLSVGFDWGGYWGIGTGGYCDPMHLSLRKIR